MALKRLRQGDPALDYLDEFDRRVSDLIHRESMGYYGQDQYECRADDMLPAMIGHPRVLDLRNPAQAVELVAGRPELVLSSDAKGFRLSVSHARATPGVVVEIETASRWRVVIVDEKAIAAAAIVAKRDIVIPKSARARLAALARLSAPLPPPRIETEEIEDAAAIAGDPSPVLRLSPAGEGLKVLQLVRPAGADGLSFLPGQGGVVVNASHGRVRRDLEAERRLAKALAAACPSLGGDGPEWMFDDVAASLELLAELRALPAPPAMEWPEGEKLAFKGEASLKRFKASVKGGESGFTLDGSLEVDAGLVLDLKDLLARAWSAAGAAS